MTITLTKPIRIGGVEVSGTQTYAADVEADLIQRGFAVPIPMPREASVRVLEFDGFYPSLLPSLVTSSTAAQSGNVVTVTATAHGIPATTFDGWRVWYPGSPTIAAGWYADFLYLTANTFSFTNPISQSVASESVNAGAAVTGYVEIARLNLPGKSIGKNGKATATVMRTGDTTAATKTVRQVLGGSTINGHAPSTSTAAGTYQYSWSNLNSEAKQRGAQSADFIAIAPTAFYATTIDTALDQIVSLTGAVSAAGGYLGIADAELEITYKP